MEFAKKASGLIRGAKKAPKGMWAGAKAVGGAAFVLFEFAVVILGATFVAVAAHELMHCTQEFAAVQNSGIGSPTCEVRFTILAYEGDGCNDTAGASKFPMNKGGLVHACWVAPPDTVDWYRHGAAQPLTRSWFESGEGFAWAVESIVFAELVGPYIVWRFYLPLFAWLTKDREAAERRVGRAASI